MGRYPKVIAAAALAVAALVAWKADVWGGVSAVVPKASWFFSRSTGWVSYGLLWTSTVLGLSTSGRVARGAAVGVVAELHRFAAALALGFSAFHGLVLLWDRYVNPTVLEVVVPFWFPYRPGWVGLGQLAAYTAAAVYLSVFARRYTGYRFWRALHYAGFGAYALATVHLLGAGTDVGPTAGAAVLASTAAVCALAWLRWWEGVKAPRGEVTGA